MADILTRDEGRALLRQHVETLTGLLKDQAAALGCTAGELTNALNGKGPIPRETCKKLGLTRLTKRRTGCQRGGMNRVVGYRRIGTDTGMGA